MTYAQGDGIDYVGRLRQGRLHGARASRGGAPGRRRRRPRADVGHERRAPRHSTFAESAASYDAIVDTIRREARRRGRASRPTTVHPGPRPPVRGSSSSATSPTRAGPSPTPGASPARATSSPPASTVDGIHPTTAGYEALGHALARRRPRRGGPAGRRPAGGLPRRPGRRRSGHDQLTTPVRRSVTGRGARRTRDEPAQRCSKASTASTRRWSVPRVLEQQLPEDRGDVLLDRTGADEQLGRRWRRSCAPPPSAAAPRARAA